jgi:hypothetical protein
MLQPASKHKQAKPAFPSFLFILFELQCWSKECGRNFVKRSPACKLTSGWEGACPYNYIVGFVFGGYAGQLGGLLTRPAVGRLPSGAGAWRRAFTIFYHSLEDQGGETRLDQSFPVSKWPKSGNGFVAFIPKDIITPTHSTMGFVFAFKLAHIS